MAAASGSGGDESNNFQLSVVATVTKRHPNGDVYTDMDYGVFTLPRQPLLNEETAQPFVRNVLETFNLSLPVDDPAIVAKVVESTRRLVATAEAKAAGVGKGEGDGKGGEGEGDGDGTTPSGDKSIASEVVESASRLVITDDNAEDEDEEDEDDDDDDDDDDDTTTSEEEEVDYEDGDLPITTVYVNVNHGVLYVAGSEDEDEMFIDSDVYASDDSDDGDGDDDGEEDGEDGEETE